MSTLKTHNLQSPDAGSVNISLAPNAGMVVAGLSTFTGNIDANGSNVSIAGVTTMTGNLTINSTSNARAIILPDNKRIYFGDGEDFWIGSNGSNGEVSGSLWLYNHLYLYDNVRLRIGHGQDLELFHNGTDSYIDNNTNNLHLDSASNIIFETGSSVERLRLTSIGAILTAGATSEPLYPHYVTARKVQMEVKGALDVGQTRHHGSLAVNCTNSNASIHLVRSDNDQGDGTHIGVLGWVGYDGSDFHQAAAIEVIKGAGAGNDDQPGHMLFKTNAGTNQATERLRINSDGTVNIGNAATVAPWSASGNVNTGVRLVNNGLTGYAISANSNDIAGIFNRTNTQGAILECKYNGQVVSAIGDNYTTFTGQKNTFRYDNSGGIGAYLSLQNRSSTANTAVGIAFGVDNSDASMTSGDYANGQIKVRNDGSGGGILSFNVHTGGNFEALKIVGNIHNRRNATNGNTAALQGGVAFSCAGIAIDKSWDNYPGLHVFNTTGHSDTNQGQFRFHGWNTSYNSYPLSSGSDFSVNLVADGTGLTSDERRKTGISTITNALNTVSQLRGVKYTQVNRELEPQTHMTMDNGQKLGFIAQEVIPHLPSIVIDSGDHVQPMENGYCDRYMIDYGSVVALLTEAVKELKSKNEALEARIASLESS